MSTMEVLLMKLKSASNLSYHQHVNIPCIKLMALTGCLISAKKACISQDNYTIVFLFNMSTKLTSLFLSLSICIVTPKERISLIKATQQSRPNLKLLAVMLYNPSTTLTMQQQPCKRRFVNRKKRFVTKQN